jgi:streptomycin 6-kinase
MEVREIGWEVVDCTHVVQDNDQGWDLANMVMDLQVPWKAGEFID